jgi:DNA-binding SARP family transcriptional activator
MRRISSALGLAAGVAGLPLILQAVAGPPTLSGLPTWTWVRGGLRDQYLPVDPLLRAMALLAWGLWAYVALVVMLRAVAVLAARRRLAGAAALLALTNLVTIPALRSMVDAAVGMSLLASTVTPASPAAAAAPAAVVRTMQAPSEWGRAHALLDTARAAPYPARAAAPATTPAASGQPARDDPSSEPEERPPAPPNKRYTVEPGDSLWRIAERELGDPYRWDEIFALNRGRHMPDGAVFHNPGLIRPGWILRLPAEPADRAVSPARPPRTRDAPRERVAPPTPTTTAPEPETRVCRPAVRLPSGSIVGLSVAVAVAAALAVARRRGRRGRLPGEPRPGIRRHDADADETLRWLERVALGGPGYGDPDADQTEPEEPARPAPPTQRVLRLLAETEAPPEAVMAQPPHDISPASAAIRSSEESRAGQGELPWPAPTPVALGHRDGEEITLELSGAGGLTLTGAGAADAAHALLVAFLSRHPPEAGEVVVAGDRLLPGIGPFPGLRRHQGQAAALAELEVEVVRRARLLQEAEAADFAGYRRADPAEPMPALLLATDTAPAALAGRLRTLAGIGQRLGIGILVVDEAGVREAEPWGARLAVDAEGTLTAASPEKAAARLAGIRLFHLTAEEAAVTLAVLADARREADLEPGPDQMSDARSPTVAGPVADDPDLGVAAANGGRLAPRADSEASGAAGDSARTAALQPSDAPHGASAASEEPFEVAPPASRPLIGVQLLGPYRIEVAGQEIRGRLRTTGRELFAYYLLHPDGATLEGAVDALWPDTQPGRESSRFWNALNSLRARLRSATGRPDLKVLERTNERYRVDADLVDVDLWRFQRALADTRDATSTADKLAALERAAAAYGGDLLTHTDYTWAEPARVDLRGRAVDTLARLAELRDQAGDRHGALAALERAITVDPDCEELYRRLMRLQADLGDPDAVRRTYRRLRAHLLDELDVEPDPTTQELYERLLAKHRRRHPSGLPEQP